MDVHLCTSVYILNVDLCNAIWSWGNEQTLMFTYFSRIYSSVAMFDRNETIIKQEVFK